MGLPTPRHPEPEREVFTLVEFEARKYFFLVVALSDTVAYFPFSKKIRAAILHTSLISRFRQARRIVVCDRSFHGNSLTVFKPFHFVSSAFRLPLALLFKGNENTQSPEAIRT